jgi:hypothetical protein
MGGDTKQEAFSGNDFRFLTSETPHAHARVTTMLMTVSAA